MKSRFALPVCAVLTLSLAAPVAAQSPNPNEPYIQSITYGGSGCRQGTVGQSFANDRKSFTLIFDEFVAHSDEGVPVTEGRKNCQVNVNVRVPAGTGAFCTQFDYRGYVNLPSGVVAEQKSTYYFTPQNTYALPDGQVIDIGGEPIVIEKAPSAFTGPISKDYLGRDQDLWNYSLAEARVSPININAQVRLIGPSDARAQITTDSIDGKIAPCAPVDTTAPAISISSPMQNGLYGLGASVTPVFACTDEEGGSGVASCTAAPALDTTSVGPKTFTVTATDNAGNSSTASVSYAVGGKEECKGGGHNQFLVPTFGNQGQCVSTYAGKKK